MKKLQEWLLGLSVTIALWAFLLKQSETSSSPLHAWSFEILIAPIVGLFLFAAYAGIVVLYRVYTFNDCIEAAEELQKEIQVARADLIKKGFKFDE